VLGYLDSLAEEAQRKGRRAVVVLDNAPLHKAGAIQDARAGGKLRGSKCTTCRRTART